MTTIPVKLTRKNFVSDQTVRWCPGCGDYSILAQIQKTLPDIGYAKEDIVFISGIGCSSRFPYYMNTYGIHSIHGRAPTLATGLAITNPNLSVWVITGDGDGLSIGGNHLIHAMRRNVNLNITLFNNRIYGLTKGQYSPTSRTGHKSKSSPMGSIEQPLNPIALALASEGTFIARSLDAHPAHLSKTLAQAAAHKGTSFVEVYQNCVIFNPMEWEGLHDRRTRDDHIIYLEHGQPLIFGKDKDKGIRLNGFQPEVIQLGNGITEEDLLVHDAHSKQVAYIISSLVYPEFPAPMGIVYEVEKPTYTEGLLNQVQAAQAAKGVGDLRSLYRAADLWTVSAHEAVETRLKGKMPAELDEEYMTGIDQEEAETTAVQDRLKEHPISALNPSSPIVASASASLAEAIEQMNASNIGCLLVVDEEGKLAGIFTERDVLMRVAGTIQDPAQEKLADHMTADPITLNADYPIAHALHLMSVHGFRHLPLVDAENRATGIISFRDVIHYLGESLS